MRGSVYLLLVLSMLFVVPGCSTDRRPPDPYLGNLDDTSYANRRDKSYETADNTLLSLADFAGDYVWVDFSAPWCPHCTPQAKIIQRLESEYTGVVFVTMITSDRDPMSRATRATARAWAKRFRLDPAHVAICTETRVLPSHMLFSPEGQLLYWSEGVHSAALIEAVISEQSQQWVAQAGTASY